jgi:carboxylate-amine ligase
MSGYPEFSRLGVELEYMIVDSETLDIRPWSDQILLERDPGYEDELEDGDVSWSHELVRHVLEVKTNGPVERLEPCSQNFSSAVQSMNSNLKARGARLLPGAAHPWMKPHLETCLWQRGNREIYETFHRIFNCRGHGWANLQSAHLNLPFSGEEDFSRLHAVIRLILPLLPALAASSPILEGKIGSALDMRLEVYRHNSAAVPSVSANTIPEAVPSMASYKKDILERIYADMAELDPEGILRHEWVNARGAIARFDRKTIEIRVIDVQECPRADLAIMQWTKAVLECLMNQECSDETYLAVPQVLLEEQFLKVIEKGEEAEMDPGLWGEWLGKHSPAMNRAGGLIAEITEWVSPSGAWTDDFETLLKLGPLARRVRSAVGQDLSRDTLRAVYASLADCLDANEFFES